MLIAPSLMVFELSAFFENGENRYLALNIESLMVFELSAFFENCENRYLALYIEMLRLKIYIFYDSIFFYAILNTAFLLLARIQNKTISIIL